jgi:hypothetical protein
MSISLVHQWVGYAIVGSWAVVGGWSLALRFLPYEDTPTFWRAVSVAQILLVLQLAVGLVLLLLGRLPAGDDWFTNVFHILYGIVFPLVVLFFAHKWSREGRYDPHTAFAVTGLVLFGLTARAWLTGFGM